MVIKRLFRLMLVFLIIYQSSTIALSVNHPGKIESEIKNKGLLYPQQGYFTENKGQWDPIIQFIGNTSFGKVIFTQDAVYYQLIKPQQMLYQPTSLEAKSKQEKHSKTILDTQIIELSFLNATSSKVVGKQTLSHFNNYFIGQDSLKWGIDCKNYTQVYFQELWEGIDLAYFFTSEGLKYEFYVKPKANIHDIQIKISGAELYNYSNKIEFRTQLGSIFDDQLNVFEQDTKQTISSHFTIHDNTISFSCNQKVHQEAIVIDPLLYSTLLGGPGYEQTDNSTIDDYGNVYLVGDTFSAVIPMTRTKNGSEIVPGYDQTVANDDAFIYKLNATGTELLYATYLGGDSYDYGNDILVDSNGNAFICGDTYANDFPMTRTPEGLEPIPGYQKTHYGMDYNYDVYLVKLNPIGNELLYASYFGGMYDEYSSCLAMDSNGYIYIGGSTTSYDFPMFTTYGGGTLAPGYDKDFNGGWYDGFVIQVNTTNNEINYASYLGGFGEDFVNRIKLDSSDQPYVLVSTSSYDFPMTKNHNGGIIPGFDQVFNGGWSDSVLIKMNAEGTKFQYATFIGGSGDDEGRDILVDEIGQVYMVGITSVTQPEETPEFLIKNRDQILADDPPLNDFPMTSTHEGTELASGYDKVFNGLSDSFAIKIDSTGTHLLYATYIGGSGRDSCDSIAIDSDGSVYIVGSTCPDIDEHYGESGFHPLILVGDPWNNDFPLTTTHEGTEYPQGYDQAFNGFADTFFIKLDSTGSQFLYSTFLGGNYHDYGINIDLISPEVAIIMGATYSDDFPFYITHGGTELAPGYDQYLDPSDGSFPPEEKNRDTYVLKINLQNSCTISASVSGGHGSVTPALQTINRGDSTKIIISPDAGYHIASITDNGSAISLPSGNDGSVITFNISNVTQNHDFIITFKVLPKPSLVISTDIMKKEYSDNDYINFKVYIYNTGGAAASNVMFSLQLPDIIAFVNATGVNRSSQSGNTFNFSTGSIPQGSYKIIDFICQINGKIEKEEKVSMVLLVTCDEKVKSEMNLDVNVVLKKQNKASVSVTVTLTNLEQDPQTGKRFLKMGESLVLTYNISGGVPPYKLTIDWGDGNVTVITIDKYGKMSGQLSHKYEVRGTVTVRIKLEDSSGQSKESDFEIDIR